MSSPAAVIVVVGSGCPWKSLPPSGCEEAGCARSPNRCLGCFDNNVSCKLHLRLNSDTGLIAKGKFCEGKLKRFLKRERFFQDWVKPPRGERGLVWGRGAERSPDRALFAGKASTESRPRLPGLSRGRSSAT